MVTYRCERCVGFPMGSACTLDYDIEVSNEPHLCPFEFGFVGLGFDGLPTPDWVRVPDNEPL